MRWLVARQGSWRDPSIEFTGGGGWLSVWTSSEGGFWMNGPFEGGFEASLGISVVIYQYKICTSGPALLLAKQMNLKCKPKWSSLAVFPSTRLYYRPRACTNEVIFNYYAYKYAKFGATSSRMKLHSRPAHAQTEAIYNFSTCGSGRFQTLVLESFCLRTYFAAC